MNKQIRTLATICAGLFVIALVGSRMGSAQEQQLSGAGFAAVPGLRGGQDIYGPYEVVENWPKPMSESCPLTVPMNASPTAVKSRRSMRLAND